MLLCMLVPFSVQAYTGVTIVMSSSSSTNLSFVKHFKAELATKESQTLRVKVIDMTEFEKLTVAENSELVVALGVKALEAASKLKYTTPVLGIFIPLPTFNRLLKSSGRRLGNFSAIVLDQPYRRQIGLAKIALPYAKTLGILLGATSYRYEDLLRDIAEKQGFSVNVENINTESKLIPKLEKIFESNDVLLAIPDPLVYNRETAQPILLTSYRHQVPVFGYSRAYVKAGALASVFSNSAHLAKQAMEIAVQKQQVDSLLPPPQVAKYFSVIINRQVERSLGLHLGDEDDIYRQLLALELKQSIGVLQQ